MEAEPIFKTPSKPAERKKAGPDCSPSLISIPASPFMQKLGYGTGVNVYLMKRSPKGISHSPWAVKKINPKCDSNQRNTYQKRLNEEAKILKNLQHPNIVGYRAFTEAKDGSMCLAMEYGGEKSLNDLIEERRAQHLGPFPAATILKVALHMARGLKYLHNDKKLLHGDIKSSNVVIKGAFESIKICDVGVSLPLDENMTVSDPEAHYIGTEPWKPKEALEEDGTITDKADIFAFGLTLWEMMTLSIPHLTLPGDDEVSDEDASFDEDDFDESAYYEALGTRPLLNVEELGPLYQNVIELFSVCTFEDPKKRPAAALIVDCLEA
ncbi:lymphokine-activated killer T-cell-originated protein kinase [Eublepharis macularius]|uniref:Lymphokine-activated killer T-cell-originated protein kinase n=1 Tax=Eublepharis macularius TaxID=481883 RepID=A0AA97JNA7_EUBMA|nr:lymphokine-activated killer T-cell-originated protein kinase [Eublepharis macularius]XP_054842121.1 lymphokine-activated killer T-cell-originated protein kinase [Eublepharis macularius]XP_054842128.1 lymphokine-activated killer T-cell-originated protein kinase [Eublepharis macularius]